MCIALLCEGSSCEPLGAAITAAPGTEGIMTLTGMPLNCTIVGPYDEKHDKTSV